MALVYIDIYGRCDLPIGNCSQVVLCMQPLWVDRTVSGFKFVYGKVVTSTKTCLSRIPSNAYSPCCTDPVQPAGCADVEVSSSCCAQNISLCCSSVSSCASTSGYEICVYQIEVDTEQFIVDPVTGTNYVPVCSDFVDIMPYVCVINDIEDKLLDCASLSAFDTPLGGYTYTARDLCGGATQVIQVISQDAGNIITPGTDNGAYLAISADAGNDVVLGTDGGIFVEADNLAVSTDATVDGDGTVLDPLSVPVSTDANNDITLGTDSKHYLDVSAVQTNSAMADSPDADYASGANKLRHTSGDGTTFDFAEGFQTVQAAALCGDTGVGADRVVKSITISGDALIVDAVHEHVSDTTGQAASASGLSVDIADAGTDTIYTGGIVTLNNPSTCRICSVLVVGDNTLQVNVTDTGVWDMKVEQNLDGAGFAAAGTAQYGPYPGTTGTAWLVPSHHEDSIPAGGSLTIQRQILVTRITPPSGAATVTGYALGMRILFVTQ